MPITIKHIKRLSTLRMILSGPAKLNEISIYVYFHAFSMYFTNECKVDIKTYVITTFLHTYYFLNVHTEVNK